MRVTLLCLAVSCSVMMWACKNNKPRASLYLHASIDKNNVHHPDTQSVPGAARINCERAIGSPSPHPAGCQLTGPDGETLKTTPGPAELVTKKAGNVMLECYGGAIPVYCDATATW
jgi:hypothetical protein